MNKPLEISLTEWQEIVETPVVREIWGLDDNETGESFASVIYGAKFRFQSGGPGYVGDLYILHGETLSGTPPVVLVRSEQSPNNTLEMVQPYAPSL